MIKVYSSSSISYFFYVLSKVFSFIFLIFFIFIAFCLKSLPPPLFYSSHPPKNVARLACGIRRGGQSSPSTQFSHSLIFLWGLCALCEKLLSRRAEPVLQFFSKILFLTHFSRRYFYKGNSSYCLLY